MKIFIKHDNNILFSVEDPIMSDTQQYRYMTVDDMKSLGDDSMKLDVTNDERHESKLITSKFKLYHSSP